MTDVTRISVIGLGYIGLPTAAMFASHKIEVIGVDVSEKAVETINKGGIHIAEPDLDIVVQAVVNRGYLRATLKPEPADAFLIAVPTPLDARKVPDISYVEAATRAIAPVLVPGNIVILESTSPITTTERMADWLAEERPDLTFPQVAGSEADINIAYCPERVLPGKVMQELINNDRIIGGMSTTCSERAAEVYRIFVKGNCLLTSPRVAEMCKLTENASRDAAIAFANELSLICDRLDINVWDVISLANRHPRVNILQPGPGVGGHCIAVDPWFIISAAPEEARLMRTVRDVNDAKPEWVVAKVQAAAAGLAPDVQRPATIACFGLTFKPDIDDLRESPALGVAAKLSADPALRVLVVEPNIAALPPVLDGQAELVSTDAAIARADIAVMLVDHKEFRAIKPDGFRGTIVDTKGIWG